MRAQVYADNIAVLSVDQNLGMVCSNTQSAIDLIDSWYFGRGLSVDSNETAMILLASPNRNNMTTGPDDSMVVATILCYSNTTSALRWVLLELGLHVHMHICILKRICITNSQYHFDCAG